jgi:outer membrane murein-binding lipoprotein Lpp
MMRNTKQTGITFGIGMLGIGLVAGFTPQASADQRAEVRQDRRQVRKAARNVEEQRRDVQRAQTPGQRAEQREQLRDARGDLRDEKQDLRQELQNRNGYNSYYRYNGNTRYIPNNRYNGNRYIPNSRYNNASVYRTLDGIVTSDYRGNGFVLRTSNGQQLSVRVPGGEPRRVSRGDRVRVYGSYTGGVFHAQNLTIVRNR